MFLKLDNNFFGFLYLQYSMKIVFVYTIKTIRGKNCFNFFLAHSYFKMSKTLRLNVNYIILFKIPKNQLSHIYNDQATNIDRE